MGGATRMPCIGRFLKRLTGLTVRPVVDPEEAVALGAAVSAGILSGAVEQKVYNPFFDDKMAPTTSKRGRKPSKTSKPNRSKEATPLSAEAAAAAAAVREAASAERDAAGAEALEDRLRAENARLVAQLDTIDQA